MFAQKWWCIRVALHRSLGTHPDISNTRDGGLKHDKEKVRNSCRKQWNFSPLSSHGKLLNNL